MDRTQDCGSCNPGSIPGGNTFKAIEVVKIKKGRGEDRTPRNTAG